MTNPTTAAGKRLQYVLSGATLTRYDCAAEIVAIEREAVAAALARVRERVDKDLTTLDVEFIHWSRQKAHGIRIARAAVLAIIEEEAGR